MFKSLLKIFIYIKMTNKEEKNLQKLDLSSEQRDKISKIAQDMRFKYDKNDLLYSTDVKKRLDYFVNAYDFLFYLMESSNEESFKNKIKNYLKQFEELYYKIKKIIEYSEGGSIRQRIFKKKSEYLLKDYSKEIKQIIIDVFPLGRVVHEYDPDSAVGI